MFAYYAPPPTMATIVVIGTAASTTATGDGYVISYGAVARPRDFDDDLAEFLASIRRKGFDEDVYVQSWFVRSPAQASRREAPRLPVRTRVDPLRVHRARGARRSPRRSWLQRSCG